MQAAQIFATPWTVALPDSFSVHGLFQARILEWIAISFYRGSSCPRDQTGVFCASCIAGRFFTAEPLGKPQERISSVQFSRSVVSDSLRPHESQHARPPCPSPIPGVYSNSCPWRVMQSSHLILCHSPSPDPIPPGIRVFSSESTLRMRWPKYWSFSFSISPSNEYSGLISFRMDWLDFLAVQGTLRVFSNTTVQKHQFFGAFLIVQLSHPYMTTGKTIALTRRTFVGKVMSLLLICYLDLS